MNSYKRHRYPPEIISSAVWVYYRFTLRVQAILVTAGMQGHSIEDLLAEHGIAVSRESIRLWGNKFGPQYAKRLKRKHQGFGDTFFLDVHSTVYNLFNLGRHLVSADHYRQLRQGAFTSWKDAVAA